MSKKKEKIGLMLDIETYGTEKDCVIRQIAMVVFRFDELSVLNWTTLYPDVQEQVEDGRSQTMATKLWWTKTQHEKHLELLKAEERFKQPCVDVAGHVRNFIEKFKKEYEVYIIARGATTFDFPILSNFLEQYTGIPLVHAYYRIFDLRSFTSIYKALTGVELVCKEDTKHDAFDDCIEQISQLRRFVDNTKNV